MPAQVIRIDVQKLRKKVLEDPETRRRLWELLAPRLAYIFPERFPIFADMSHKTVRHFFFDKKNVEIFMLEEGQEVNLPAGGILWSGKIATSEESQQ